MLCTILDMRDIVENKANRNTCLSELAFKAREGNNK